MVPEIDYDVVDLPAQDFSKLTSNAVLRSALGILKKPVGKTGFASTASIVIPKTLENTVLVE
jgi:hypothetical protein